MRTVFSVEYCPNKDEGEQWQEVTEGEFIELVHLHKDKGLFPYVKLGKGHVTLVDANGIYYG